MTKSSVVYLLTHKIDNMKESMEIDSFYNLYGNKEVIEGAQWAAHNRMRAHQAMLEPPKKKIMKAKNVTTNKPKTKTYKYKSTKVQLDNSENDEINNEVNNALETLST